MLRSRGTALAAHSSLRSAPSDNRRRLARLPLPTDTGSQALSQISVTQLPFARSASFSAPWLLPVDQQCWAQWHSAHRPWPAPSFPATDCPPQTAGSWRVKGRRLQPLQTPPACAADCAPTACTTSSARANTPGWLGTSSKPKLDSQRNQRDQFISIRLSPPKHG